MKMMRRYSILLLSLVLIAAPQKGDAQSLFQRAAQLMSKKNKGDLDDIPTTTLSNGVRIPLVGMGVGNMVGEVIPAMVSQGLQSDKKIRLIDTSNISQNEHLVAKGIAEGVEKLKATQGKEKVEVHVVTKVWYTHLGYDRTKQAVQSSLDSLKEAIDNDNVNLKVHVMIHWPRCYDNISWMNCEEEENELPDVVKQAGPPPHLDKANAWKASWKALEDIYEDQSNPVVSIGISNFHLKEVETLTALARVQPHIVQTNVWSLLYDPLLVGYCHKRDIHLQSFHLMNGVIRKRETAPFAYHHILTVANELTKDMQSKELIEAGTEISAAQGLLAWLVQHQVSVIPRTTDLEHLSENSAMAIGRIPELTDPQVKTVAISVEAMLSGEDVKEDAYVKITFHAKTKDFYLYWHDLEYGGEIQVSLIEKGKSFEESSHPGHAFRIYDSEEKSNYELFKVEGNYGDHHHVEL
jgi:diketogulonate reductase-like aldo/keto reductase